LGTVRKNQVRRNERTEKSKYVTQQGKKKESTCSKEGAKWTRERGLYQGENQKKKKAKD